jgi:hypothetical protein
MKNPWIKKNPFMSMWLSGANAVFGAARSRATAEARRQSATMMSEITKAAFNVWNPRPTSARRRRKRKTR